MFGVEALIVIGGMTDVGYAPLAVAVANAGALGFINAPFAYDGGFVKRDQALAEHLVPS